MISDPLPLDPNEGPTIWATPLPDNQFTYKVMVGTDPEDPQNTILLSANEIHRLSLLVEESNE